MVFEFDEILICTALGNHQLDRTKQIIADMSIKSWPELGRSLITLLVLLIICVGAPWMGTVLPGLRNLIQTAIQIGIQ